jgi:hypothetical protein
LNLRWLDRLAISVDLDLYTVFRRICLDFNQSKVGTQTLVFFFDHFLKGAPAPEWMEKGIPYLQREKEKEKYRATEDDLKQP